MAAALVHHHVICGESKPHYAYEHAHVHRLTNGFSKKIEDHASAIVLHAMHYNFVRVHSTLR